MKRFAQSAVNRISARQQKVMAMSEKSQTKREDSTADARSHKFLLKSEPSAFSIEDLQMEPNETTSWDGVRNYQARNIMKEMKCGDLCFFYHSNAKPPSIVGIVKVVKESYPDHTAWEGSPNSKAFDAASTPDNPRWFMVDVQFVRLLHRPLPLPLLKSHKDSPLKGMPLLTNSRLSVQCVPQAHWDFILELEKDDSANV